MAFLLPDSDFFEPFYKLICTSIQNISIIYVTRWDRHNTGILLFPKKAIWHYIINMYYTTFVTIGYNYFFRCGRTLNFLLTLHSKCSPDEQIRLINIHLIPFREWFGNPHKTLLKNCRIFWNHSEHIQGCSFSLFVTFFSASGLICDAALSHIISSGVPLPGVFFSNFSFIFRSFSSCSISSSLLSKLMISPTWSASNLMFSCPRSSMTCEIKIIYIKILSTRLEDKRLVHIQGWAEGQYTSFIFKVPTGIVNSLWLLLLSKCTQK